MTSSTSVTFISGFDVADTLISTFALMVVGLLVLQIIKLRSTQIPTPRQLTLFAITGFIVSIIAGILAVFGIFAIAVTNTPGWPHETEEQPDWTDLLFSLALPSGIMITLIGMIWTIRCLICHNRSLTIPPPDEG